MKNKEPKALRRGKAFHKLIQGEWENTAEGDVFSERWVLKTSGRKGRVDVFVSDDTPKGCNAIIEIKASDWDRMTVKALRRNVRRQINQVVGYIETQIKDGEYVSSGEQKAVSPGIIFSRRPQKSGRKEMIEQLFIKEGIVVIWYDEQNPIKNL